MTSSDVSMHVTLVSTVILSSGNPSFRDVTCFKAVKNAVGLNSPGSHKGFGRDFMELVHRRMSPTRSTKSASHDERFFREGHACFSHEHVLYRSRPGTWIREEEVVTIAGYMPAK